MRVVGERHFDDPQKRPEAIHRAEIEESPAIYETLDEAHLRLWSRL